MTTEQEQSTTEDRPDKATSSTTDRPIASGDGRSASFAVSGPDSPATDDSNDSGPYIDDIAPRRTRDFGDLTRAGLSLLMAAVVMVFAVYLGGMTRGVESDAHTAAQVINWLADFPSTVLTQLATIVIVIIVLAQLLLAREWLQAAVSALAMFAGYGIVWVISTAISSLNDFTLPMALVSAATSYGSGLLPDIYAGMASFLTAAGPRRTRSTVKWSWNILYAIAAVMVVLSWHSVTGMLVSMAAGRTVGMLIRFVVGTQNKGVWGKDLVAVLSSIGLETTSLIRHQEPGISHGSLSATLDDDLAEGSRIYDVKTANNRRFIVSVIDAQTHTVGYLKQLWDWVRFTSVSIRRDRSVRDAVQHHFAMLLGLHNIKLPAPAPYGIADTDESAILVLDAHTIELPANLNTLTQADAVAYMRYLSVANRRGYTHRRITPDTLARLEDGTAVIAGWLNGDSASGPANTALDKVQLLALFAALIGVKPAVAAAREAWGDTTLTTLAPFIQKVAVPSPTRALGTWDKQLLKELRDHINTIIDEETAESAEPVTLARFSWRSMITMLLVIVAVVVVFTQLKPEEIITALTNANPLMAVVTLAFGACGWIGSSISLGALMDRNRRDNTGVFHESGCRRLRHRIHACRRGPLVRQPAVPAQIRLSQHPGHRNHERRARGVLRRVLLHAGHHRPVHRPQHVLRRNPDKHVGYRAGRGGCGAVHCDDDSAVAPLGDPSSYAAGQDVYQPAAGRAFPAPTAHSQLPGRAVPERDHWARFLGGPASVRPFIESD